MTPADRVLLLECRLEELRSSLAEARAEADRARGRLAEAAAREAEHARHHGLAQEELAAAREEVAALHRRLERSEALRAGMDGRLFEAGSHDAEELVRLRREASGTRGERGAYRQTLAHLRARVEELVANREVLLNRVVEWHRLVRQGDPEAVDLAEFIAALRRDILELEHQNFLGGRREAELRRQLVEAGAVAGADRDRESSDPPATPGAREDAGVDVPRDGADARAAHDAERATDGSEAATDAGEAATDAGEEAMDAPEAATEASESATGVGDPALIASDTDRLIPVTGPDSERAPDHASSAAADREVAETTDDARMSDRAPTGPAARPSTGGRARDLAGALAVARDPRRRIDLLLRLGRCGEEEAFYAVRPSATASEPDERAAAYQALGRLLERDPARLEPYVRWGISDADARVRRRVILAAASARGLELRALLEPLRADPDPQVRRVVNEVLRGRPPVAPDLRAHQETEPGGRRPIRSAPGVAS